MSKFGHGCWLHARHTTVSKPADSAVHAGNTAVPESADVVHSGHAELSKFGHRCRLHPRHTAMSKCSTRTLHSGNTELPDFALRAVHTRHTAVSQPADDFLHAGYAAVSSVGHRRWLHARNAELPHPRSAVPKPGGAMHNYARHSELLIACGPGVYAWIGPWHRPPAFPRCSARC